MRIKGLGELKKFLPHNYRKLTVEHFVNLKEKPKKYHPNYVYAVAVGKLTNWVMLEFLRTLAEENMKIGNRVIDSNRRIKK